MSDGARIDVTVSELYDSTYVGNPHDLVKLYSLTPFQCIATYFCVMPPQMALLGFFCYSLSLLSPQVNSKLL